MLRLSTANGQYFWLEICIFNGSSGINRWKIILATWFNFDLKFSFQLEQIFDFGCFDFYTHFLTKALVALTIVSFQPIHMLYDIAWTYKLNSICHNHDLIMRKWELQNFSSNSCLIVSKKNNSLNTHKLE